MSPFLDNLIARSQEVGEFVRPRLPSLFESSPGRGEPTPMEASFSQQELGEARTWEGAHPAATRMPQQAGQDRAETPQPSAPLRTLGRGGLQPPAIQPTMPFSDPRKEAAKDVAQPHDPAAQPLPPPQTTPPPKPLPSPGEETQHPEQPRLAGRVVSVAAIKQDVQSEKAAEGATPERPGSELVTTTKNIVTSLEPINIQPSRQSLVDVVPRPSPSELPPPPAPAFVTPFQRRESPSARAERQAEPTIHVSIGRIEVRAVAAPASAPSSFRERPKASAMSLEDYMRQRTRRGGE